MLCLNLLLLLNNCILSSVECNSRVTMPALLLIDDALWSDFTEIFSLIPSSISFFTSSSSLIRSYQMGDFLLLLVYHLWHLHWGLPASHRLQQLFGYLNVACLTYPQ